MKQISEIFGENFLKFSLKFSLEIFGFGFPFSVAVEAIKGVCSRFSEIN